jgi:hypothetical protein
MKKILSALVLLIIGNCAFPQSLRNSIPSENPEVSPAVLVSENIAPASMSKAVRNFDKTFKNVIDEKWYLMPDGYRVNFTAKDVRFRLDYDKKGNWLHTIRYYDEKKLPVEIRRLVVSSYLDYSIRTVEEIEAPHNILFYVIHLEGETNWINMKVSDNEINELEKIKKS